jgi:hypothetical protein
MINHKHKYIFIHIPKCGGSSIEKVLRRGGGHESISNKKSSDFKINSQHASLSEQIEFYNINKNIFSFTFIRNPWSRFVSYFFHLKNIGFVKKKVSFNEFTMDLLLRNWDCEYIAPVHPPKNFMAPCAEWVSGVSFVGKLENFQEDFNIICDKIGIPSQKLPHENKGKHKHYTKYYDTGARQLVAEKYAKDIEMFGYKFGS